MCWYSPIDVVPQINSGKPVVVDFWATWCGPCRLISPTFEKLSEVGEGVGFYKVDVDEAEMPTFMLFKDGSKVADMVGANPPALE
ncbi:hypothetical protein FRC10_012154, partial [Ceratobasidium sp. 414]